MQAYLGVDVGSVSTNLVVMNEEEEVIESLYLRTEGQPVKTVQEGLRLLGEKLPEFIKIAGVGVTGSARMLICLLYTSRCV